MNEFRTWLFRICILGYSLLIRTPQTPSDGQCWNHRLTGTHEKKKDRITTMATIQPNRGNPFSVKVLYVLRYIFRIHRRRVVSRHADLDRLWRHFFDPRDEEQELCYNKPNKNMKLLQTRSPKTWESCRRDVRIVRNTSMGCGFMSSFPNGTDITHPDSAGATQERAFLAECGYRWMPCRSNCFSCWTS